MESSEKAKLFLEQHHQKNILVLPNVWDRISATFMASQGYPSLATASASIAWTNGYADGEHIPLGSLLEIVKNITRAVEVPVSVDFERGYAKDIYQLKENIRMLVDTGASGLNIEDGTTGKSLTPLAEQCKKIEVIKETALSCGINMVVNARTDAFILNLPNALEEAVARANAFANAGADCFYPVLIKSYESIHALLAQIHLPINVLLIKPIGDLKKLEALGVKRVSLGPGTLKYMLTQLQLMVSGLKAYDTERFFEDELISSEQLEQILKA